MAGAQAGTAEGERRGPITGPDGTTLALLLIATLIGVVFAQLLTGSLRAFDTDLWYHLAAGRYVFEHGALPADAWFSFLEPRPEQLDYYWGFQVLVYGLHSLFGPAGLVALQAFAWLGLALLVTGLVWRGGARGAWLAAVVALAALFLLGRFQVPRPHMASYLLIAGTLFLLEHRRGSLWPLPLLAVAQANLHGIEYPVLLAVLGAYGGETVWRGLVERRRPEPGELRRLGWIVGAMLALLLTPYGVALLATPFTPLPWASAFIPELVPRGLDDWGDFAVHGFVPDRATLLHLLLALAALAGVAALGRRPLRPAHGVLALVALVLLPRAQRFSTEAVLLLLPLLATSPFPKGVVPWPRALRALGWAGAFAGVLLFCAHFFRAECAGWVCREGLPQGSVAWLDAHARSGERVLHHPNHGGYLEAELPDQRLFVDMQTPFLFSEHDVLRAHRAFDDEDAFAALVGEYEPAFVLVPLEARGFPRAAAQRAGYTPVFFDDASVLYARADADLPRARRHAVVAVDPWDPSRPLGSPEQVRAELERMRRVDGGSARALTLASLVAFEQGQPARALELARRLEREWPMRVEGSRLLGRALLESGRVAEACEAYERALARNRALDVPDPRGREQLHAELARCYERAERPEAALAALQRAIPDPYRPGTDAPALLRLARAHRRVGEVERARDLLAFARTLADPEDAALAAALDEEGAALAQPARSTTSQ